MKNMFRNMLRPLRNAFCLFCICTATLSPQSLAQRVADKDQQLARLTRNQDGTITVFKRNPANTVLRKETFLEKENGERVLITFTIYKRDKFGNLRNGGIYDGQNTKLFRIIYGYHKKTGRLIAENMYDSRVRRTYANHPTKEEPVRTARYYYNAQGKRSAPIVITSQAGQTSEELMEWLKKNKPGNDVDADPFRKTPVNPNAKPIGR